jgi:hypothetical protein
MLDGMRLAGLYRLSALVLLPLAALVSTAAYAQSPSVTVAPAYVEAGSPELICVTAPTDILTGSKADRTDTQIEGDWQGHALQFFPGRSAASWYALAGVDVEAVAGPSLIKISIHRNNSVRELRSTITIHPAHYRTTSITVAPKFVEPGPEEQKRIAAEIQVKQKVYAASADRPLWLGSFAAPVKAQPTDSFGTRRMFNGKLASVHKGMDFRAAMSTVVRAGNAGTVVLAQPLYYEGNCVIVDHGMGLMSLYMHFSRIDVKPGQTVAKGERLGLSGATGRVTGPHLHWAIRWQGAMLDPAKLLRLDLNSVR